MTIISSRKIIESPITQAEREVWAYDLDTTKWGSLTPSNPVCFIYVDDQDKSSVHLAGSASVVGTIITTQTVQDLKREKRYRLVIEWDQGTNHLSTFVEIIGEKP